LSAGFQCGDDAVDVDEAVMAALEPSEMLTVIASVFVKTQQQGILARRILEGAGGK
jgi:hypothetical protein